MTTPMILLAVGSVVSGALLVLPNGGALQNWLEPVLGQQIEKGGHTISPLILTLLTLLIVAGGAVAAFVQFGRNPVPTTAPIAVTPMTVAARKNLYFDAINESLLMRPGQYLTRALVFLDNRGIDGAVNGVAAAIGGGSGRLRRVQTGFVRSYALSMFGGAAVVVAALLAVRLGT
jgi:NADH-quinone oxidoreductase subunit L